ncbi:hypothetical protein GCM10009819_03290 [Agromyces tropicus]|uniref:Uncharacterized protein n=1 Tax=Agromyces tropicus TaxID=555371 RepID=A0ABN2TWY3_9MICO
MTSSQEPPLTRRELRERERLREQQRAAASPDGGGQAPAGQAPPPRQHQPPQQPPAQGYPPQQRPAYPQGGDPRQGGRPRPQAPAQGGPPPQRPPQGWSDPRQQGGRPPQDGTRGPTRSGPMAVPQQQQQPRPANASGPMPVPAGGRGYPPQGQPPPGPPPGQYPPQGGPARPPQGPPRSAPAPQTTPERTLTRRELRAMLESHAGDGFEDVDDVEPQSAPRRPAPAAGMPQRAPQGPGGERGPGQPHRPPHHPAPSRAAAPHTTVDGGLDEPVAAPKPVGHWTSQLNLPEDRSEPYDQLLSRGGSSGGVPTTTNALILPSLPDEGAIGQPFAPSGEIIVTGSIDLPRSYGATGVHPSQIDSSDVDRIFDSVEDVSGPGVAPIAATRAISTQQPNRAMMAPPSKEGMNVPLVLAVTAGVLALGVVATLVVGAMTGLF